MMNEPISSIMSTEIISFSPDDKLSDVLESFKSHKIHHVPIVDGTGKLVGLITTSDLLWLNRSFDDYSSIRVGDVMSTKLARLGPDSKVGTAAEIFLKNWFHALPIVDDNDTLVGIVTTFDVLMYEYKKEYPKEYATD